MTDPTDRIRQILERHHPYGQSDHARHVAEDIVGQLELRREKRRRQDAVCQCVVRRRADETRRRRITVSQRSGSAATRPLATASRRVA